jgi:Ca-activated chloride channel family protein
LPDARRASAAVGAVSFAWPTVLVALLAVPATLIFVVAADRRRARHPVAFTNLDVLAAVVEKAPAWRRWVPVILLLLALALGCAALARPRAHVTVAEQNATVVLLVDVSGSMRATDVRPSRLDAAVNALHTLVDRLPQGVKVGLVTFSSTPDVITPPTTDRDTVNNSLNFLAPEAATALGDGVVLATRVAVRSLAAAGVHAEPGQTLPAAIVLESDGAQNRGSASPTEAARVARKAGVRVYGIALGTPTGTISSDFGLTQTTIPVPPDPATVREIARITGGRSFTAQTADRAFTVYSDLGSSIGRKSENRELTSWFAAATAVLLVTGVGLARAWAAPLP